MLDTTHARAGGFSPKCSLKTALNEEKSRGSSSQTPQRTTCAGPSPASFKIDSRLRIACCDCATMLPAITSPLTIGTWPDTYSHPSASTARAKGRCCPPVPLPPSTPYRLILILSSLTIGITKSFVQLLTESLNPGTPPTR